MSLRRRIQRRAATAGRATPDQARSFFGRMLPPEQSAELAGPGIEGCDKRPPNLPDDMACCFRKGHTCECRFFGDIEKGA